MPAMKPWGSVYFDRPFLAFRWRITFPNSIRIEPVFRFRYQNADLALAALLRAAKRHGIEIDRERVSVDRWIPEDLR